MNSNQDNKFFIKKPKLRSIQQNSQQNVGSPIKNLFGSPKSRSRYTSPYRNQIEPYMYTTPTKTPTKTSTKTPTKTSTTTPRKTLRNIQNNNNPNKTPTKRLRSLFNTNTNTFIDHIKANENLKNITKNSNFKSALMETKKKLLVYLQKNNTINITNIENTVVSKKNIESNTRGSSSIVFYCIYNNKLAVIKILDTSERSRNEIEITKYLAKKDITPEVYKDGQLTVDNISYLYFITERYDGDLLNIKQKMSDTITRDYIKGEIKNELYSKFHNLLKLKGYYLLHDDISPTNFVFKNNRDGTYTFKLVDFDRIILVDITDAYHGSELLDIDRLLNKISL